MSTKNKYFQVVMIASVSAPNKTEAMRAAVSRSRVTNTSVLARTTHADRIYADDARELAEALLAD